MRRGEDHAKGAPCRNRAVLRHGWPAAGRRWRPVFARKGHAGRGQSSRHASRQAPREAEALQVSAGEEDAPEGLGRAFRRRQQRHPKGVRLALRGDARGKRRSFGGLRHLEKFRQDQIARNAGDRFDLNGPLWRDLPTLPAENGRLVDRRREELAEVLKAHPVVLFAISGDGGSVFHGANSCISCNYWQEGSLHVAITICAPQLITVVT